MTTLLCRLCWNSEGWRRPTGEARRLETQSYVVLHGFGHEEWLFNHEWTLNGQRFGFIQALNSSRRKYAGQSVDLLLYTRSPSGLWCKVASISNVHVLTESEAQEAARQIRLHGWLESMQADLQRLDIPGEELDRALPHEIANIRFTADSFTLLDPPEPLADQENVSLRYRRYRAYLFDGMPLPVLPRRQRGRRPAARLKPTDLRPRCPTPAGLQDPKHDRLQNAVYTYLVKHCTDVEYEADWMDLRATVQGRRYIFEVKAASTAKRCLRDALGQLLEYAHYPSNVFDDPLVIVGDARMTDDDRRYVQLLRDAYGLRIDYAQYDWQEGRLLGIPKRAV